MTNEIAMTNVQRELLDEKCERLLDTLRGYGSCAVAYSGGVDSAVVAKAAQLALGDRAVAVTGVSASLAEGELEAAHRTAELIGIRHEVLSTDEFNDASYTANPANRCYFCKTELYEQLQPLAARLRLAVVANGANLDDAGDWRPGMKAADREGYAHDRRCDGRGARHPPGELSPGEERLAAVFEAVEHGSGRG